MKAPLFSSIALQEFTCSWFLLSLLSDTTRVQKSYEMNGREYHYVSKETFENMVYSHR